MLGMAVRKELAKGARHSGEIDDCKAVDNDGWHLAVTMPFSVENSLDCVIKP